MNKEKIYDSQISPLMAQIIEVCKANKIAMLATFHIAIETDENLQCITALLGDVFAPPKQFIEALHAIRPRARSPLMVTSRDAAGKIIGMTAIL